MKAAFPRPGEPMPHHHICELHITRAIERTLEANGGRAPAQRPHDDRLGAVPSLYL